MSTIVLVTLDVVSFGHVPKEGDALLRCTKMLWKLERAVVDLHSFQLSALVEVGREYTNLIFHDVKTAELGEIVNTLGK